MPPFPEHLSDMRSVLILSLALLIGGCSFPLFFRVPILQGNVVTTDKVKQLEIGMTPKQVRYVLGTPLIQDSFDRHRWDYVFYYRDPRGIERESRLSLFFEDGKLARIEGDEDYKALLPEPEDGIEPDVNTDAS